MTARELADKYHHNQKYGNYPYGHHLDMVEAEMRASLKLPLFQFYDRKIALNAAQLHDALEDTALTFKEIEDNLGTPTANLVFAVTDEPGKNRKERKAATYPKIRDTGPLAVALKLADRIANVRSCIETNQIKLLQMYTREYDELFNNLHLHSDGLGSVWNTLQDLLGIS